MDRGGGAASSNESNHLMDPFSLLHAVARASNESNHLMQMQRGESELASQAQAQAQAQVCSASEHASYLPVFGAAHVQCSSIQPISRNDFFPSPRFLSLFRAPLCHLATRIVCV